jgi:hypothetical protein
MKTLVLLYFLYLEIGGAGQGKVTILAIARYMRLSKTAMKKMLVEVAEMGLVDVVEKYGAGDYKKYLISLSADGQGYLDRNFDAAITEYRKHVAETIALINERNSGKYPNTEKRMSKKQAAAIIAGQKELF